MLAQAPYNLSVGAGDPPVGAAVQPITGLKLIDIRAFGAKPDGNCTEAIRAADRVAAETGGIVVFPPLNNKCWRINSTIEKDVNTLWLGAGPAKYNPDPAKIGTGSAIYAEHGGVAIRVRPEGKTVYDRGAGFRGLLIFGDEHKPDGVGIHMATTHTPGGARGHLFQDLILAGFVRSNLHFDGGGEYEFRRVFSWRSEKCISGQFADSWFVGINHFGSGKEFANPNKALCYGGHFKSLRNITSFGTRWQECIGGQGLYIAKCQNCSFDDIWDGSDGGGASIGNFEHLILRGRAFRNGMLKQSGVALELWASQSAGPATISLMAFDEHRGTAREVQRGGILFSGRGKIRNVELLGCDLTGVDHAVSVEADLAELRVTGGQGLRAAVTEVGDEDLHWSWPMGAGIVRLTSPLTRARALRLHGAGMPEGEELRVVRGPRTGDEQWQIISEEGGLHNLSKGEWLILARIGDSWAPVGAGRL